MDGLPKQFLSSLRVLFDILDENRTGFIRLRDIESRWSDDGVRGLPAGIVEALRKVTPSNGLLSFDKFVSGLKLVLSSRSSKVDNVNEQRRPFLPRDNFVSHSGYQSEREIPTKDLKAFYSSDNKQSLHHHSRQHDYRQLQPNVNNKTFSQSQKNYEPGINSFAFEHEHNQSKIYSGRPVTSPVNDPNSYTIKADVSNYPNSSGPLRQSQSSQFYHGRRGSQSNPSHQDKAPAVPPRTGRSSSYLKKSQSGSNLHHSQSPPAVPPREATNSRVLSDLQNWQREWTTAQSHSKPLDQNRSHNSNQDQSAIYANLDQFQKLREVASNQTNTSPQKATVRRHGSGRRHTLTSGVDQNMMKRMKQLDDEGSMLRAGLSILDSARDWYTKQLAIISDKQSMIGKVSYTDNSLEAHQERMNFQRAQISEVNQRLKTLVESSERGFPLHMNLALPSRAPPPVALGRDQTGQASTSLSDRNRRLMEEMNLKNEKIAQLEKEKASLVRDLFETRSKYKSAHDDTTFM